ncbi:MAG: hypothetical protein V1930_00335, partial [Pseudomonadota bacterium]
MSYITYRNAELNVFMHLQRWLTGIVATPFLIYIIGPGPQWLLCLLLFIASIFGIKEFYTMVTPTLPRFLRIM